MDKIYSRKRITLPKICISRFSSRKEDIRRIKLLKIILILIIAIFTMVYIVNGINPIINKLCKEACVQEATLISSQKSEEVMSEYTYSDMVTIYRDSDDNITMIKSNVMVINAVTSKVAEEIQKGFEEDKESIVYLKLR